MNHEEAKRNFIEDIKAKYLDKESDVCMFDILSNIKPTMSMTLEDCFNAYCELMNWSDGDAFLRVNQAENFCKDITADREYKCTEIFNI